MRRVLVGMSGIALSIILEDPILLLWGVAYVMGDVIYVGFLRSRATRATRVALWTAVAISFVVGNWVSFGALYLLWLNLEGYVFLASCIVIGQCLHCISSHSAFGIALLVDIICIVICGLGITAMIAMGQPSGALALAFFVGGIAATSYFLHSVYKVVAERTVFRNRFEAEIQDRKMLALGQFTTGVAQDFSTLLSTISRNIEMACREPVSPAAKEKLLSAIAETRNASDMANQLIAYSRKADIQSEEVDLTDLIGRVEKISNRQMPASIELETRAPVKRISMETDDLLLETALLNLINNAREAMNGSGGRVVLSTVETSADSISILVEDNGPGMTPDVLAQAKDPFFTTKAPNLGPGLGLSMVNGFAEQSGGKLALKNIESGGLQAKLTLPRRTKAI